jgi:hypothetical protein
MAIHEAARQLKAQADELSPEACQAELRRIAQMGEELFDLVTELAAQ